MTGMGTARTVWHGGGIAGGRFVSGRSEAGAGGVNIAEVAAIALRWPRPRRAGGTRACDAARTYPLRRGGDCAALRGATRRSATSSTLRGAAPLRPGWSGKGRRDLKLVVPASRIGQRGGKLSCPASRKDQLEEELSCWSCRIDQLDARLVVGSSGNGQLFGQSIVWSSGKDQLRVRSGVWSSANRQLLGQRGIGRLLGVLFMELCDFLCTILGQDMASSPRPSPPSDGGEGVRRARS